MIIFISLFKLFYLLPKQCQSGYAGGKLSIFQNLDLQNLCPCKENLQPKYTKVTDEQTQNFTANAGIIIFHNTVI